jgi:hypothetical protein
MLDATPEIVKSQEFQTNFNSICRMEVIPDITLQNIKVAKANFIDALLTNNQANATRLGNAGRLLGSWLDGVLEYTILKHEVVVLRMKNKRVLEQIQAVSQMWPRKKEFIEGAYKILIFSKGQRKYASTALSILREDQEFNTVRSEGGEGGNAEVVAHYFDYKRAFNQVMRNFYEQRIAEEKAKNKKLYELHNQLVKMKELQEKNISQRITCQQNLQKRLEQEHRHKALLI